MRQSTNAAFVQKLKKTIDYLIYVCSTLAPNEFKYRRDKIRKYLHWKRCQHIGKWFRQKCPTVLEN